MQNNIDFEFAQPAAAEVPLVIAYFVALMLFASAWSNFGSPTLSITEIKGRADTALRIETVEWTGI